MNLKLAKFLGALAIPFVRIFYRGMKLIPTYTDVNLMKSISLSMKSLSTGENLIIFPEDRFILIQTCARHFEFKIK